MRCPALVCAAAVCASAGPGAASADRLSPADLARKTERGHVTMIPLAAYSVDFGFGGGARSYYFFNGLRSDPRFARTPYLHRVFLQAFATTTGAQFHWLDYDAPEVFDSPYRIRAQLVLARNTAASYYGLGDASRRLHFPGAPGTFARYDAYRAAQHRAGPDGMAYSKYDQLDALRPSAIAGVERTFAGGRLRLIGGLGLSYMRLRDYTGTTVDATGANGDEIEAIQAPTRLREDCDAGLVVGCEGGRDNYLRLGVAYDTRDYEPDPNRGVFADAELDLGTVALGGEYTYAKLLVAARGWWSPVPARADLVLAGRVTVFAQSEGTPFFTMSIMPYTEDPHFGLGGHRTIRGFRQDRFVGHFATLANAEVRWTFWRTVIKRQRFAFIAAPFLDYGRVFDGARDFTFRGWLPGYGAALRVSWNLSTIGTIDYGFSREGGGLYVNFGHMF